MDVYAHAVSGDDRKIASQLGEILCPNVPIFTVTQTAGNALVEMRERFADERRGQYR